MKKILLPLLLALPLFAEEPTVNLPVPFGTNAALITWYPLAGEDVGGFKIRWGLERGQPLFTNDAPCLLTEVVTCYTNVNDEVFCATNTRTLRQPNAFVLTNLPPDVPIFATVAGYNILGEEGPQSYEVAFVSWQPVVPARITCEKAVLPGHISTSVLITNDHTRIAVSTDLSDWQPLAEVFITHPTWESGPILTPSVLTWTFSSHLYPHLYFRTE